MSRATDDLALALGEDVRRMEAELADLKALISTLRAAKAALSLPPMAAANDNACTSARPSGRWPKTILECRAFTNAEDPRVETNDDAPTRKIGVVR